MKTTSNTIVFFGNERLATGVSTDTPVLRQLIAAGYTIAAIVSNYEVHASRTTRKLEIAAVAEEHGIPLLLPKRLADIAETLRAAHADIGVLVAYGKLVPQSIIDLFPHGIVNIHPSLLPLHRGPTPIESAILADEVTGVTLMELAKAMDAGPIYAQSDRISLAHVSKQWLADALLLKGSELLLKCLPAIIDGSLKPIPQDEHHATYDNKIQKADGLLDWNKPAQQLEREIRAYAGWPKSRTTIFDKEVAITEASISDHTNAPGTIAVDSGQLFVGCKKGALQISKLVPAGKKEMSAQAFLSGYRK